MPASSGRGHRPGRSRRRHDEGRLFLYEVWRSQEDLDPHNATPPLRAFLDNLLDYLEEAPDGYFNTMASPYPIRGGS
ncbi:putative quinol monooxygenase [Streptomyces sp. DT9]